MNKLVKDGKITIDGNDVQVEMFLGGDYKVILVHTLNYCTLLFCANTSILIL